LRMTRVGEPDAGNLHVRFDEGEQLTTAPYSTAFVLRAEPDRDPWQRDSVW
jgi:hypothetical protein